MMYYLLAERKKYKHSLMSWLQLFIPVLLILFVTFSIGFYLFQCGGMYYWYAFLSPGIAGIYCLLAINQEEKSNYSNINFSLPVNLFELRIAQNMNIIIKMLFTQIIYAGMIFVIPLLLFPQGAIYGARRFVIANLVIFLISLWQIPFTFLLMRKIGKVITIFLNVIISLVVGATTIEWLFFIPYTWAPREMEAFLQIQRNGALNEITKMLDVKLVMMLFLAIIFFGVCLFIDSKFYEMEPERR